MSKRTLLSADEYSGSWFVKAAFIFALLAGVGGNALIAQSPVIYSSPGTYTFTVPACVTSFKVECWGAGGGGGGASEAGGGAAASGGGGGGFATATLTNVSGSYTVKVGAGGTGGIGTGSTGPNGTAGGNSSLTNGTVTVTAFGGGAGGGSTGGQDSPVGMGGSGSFAGVTGSTYSGGNGAMGNNADDNTGGAGGGGAGNAGSGSTPSQTQEDANATGGAGGTGSPNTATYAGGAGGSVTAAYYENGDNGSTIGGGGGGGGGETSGGLFGHGTYPGSGGNGGNGQVIITYTTSTPTISIVLGSGCVGSTVTIEGTLLSGATTVAIGSTAVTNLNITSTVITGTIAAGTRSGVVTVITPCGTATSSSSFTVYPTPPPVDLGTQSICGSGGYEFGGHNYTTPGTYSDTTTSVDGCDSITTITLVAGATINKSLSQSICAGNTYNFDGNSYSTAGTYADTTTSFVTGCDSITTLTLSVSPVLSNAISQSICAGSSYDFGGTSYSVAGTYTDTATSFVTGCDSITTLTLSVSPVLYSAMTQSICDGSTYSFNGTSYAASGTYADTLIGAGNNGCDSISALILTVNPVTSSVINGAICNGANYNFNGVNYTTAGTYSDTLIGASAGGCDSIVTLNLVLKSGSGDTVNATASLTTFCPGDSTQICATPGFASYQWNTNDSGDCFYTTNAGTYSVTVTDTSGCTATSNQISVFVYESTPISTSIAGDTITCNSAGEYQWYFNNQPLTGDTSDVIIALAPGNYAVQITDSNGCQSTSAIIAITTAIDGLQNDAEISIFPNPISSGNWQLEVGENLVGGWCELFDAGGRSVLKSQIRSQHSEISADLAKGVYIMQIRSAQLNYTAKLIKLN